MAADDELQTCVTGWRTGRTSTSRERSQRRVPQVAETHLELRRMIAMGQTSVRAGSHVGSRAKPTERQDRATQYEK